MRAGGGIGSTTRDKYKGAGFMRQITTNTWERRKHRACGSVAILRKLLKRASSVSKSLLTEFRGSDLAQMAYENGGHEETTLRFAQTLRSW